MSDIKQVIVVGDGPIKDAASLHGKDIGYVYGGYGIELSVDFELEHDLWVPIVNPPTWRDTKKQGWIKKSRIFVDKPGIKQYLITVLEDGTATIKVLN